MSKAKILPDKGLEYNIIIELHEWRALSVLTYRDFHGQEVGEDTEFDNLCRRERRAYVSLLKKIEDYTSAVIKEGGE
jgi:hypothetical protein